MICCLPKWLPLTQSRRRPLAGPASMSSRKRAGQWLHSLEPLNAMLQARTAAQAGAHQSGGLCAPNSLLSTWQGKGPWGWCQHSSPSPTHLFTQDSASGEPCSRQVLRRVCSGAPGRTLPFHCREEARSCRRRGHLSAPCFNGFVFL